MARAPAGCRPRPTPQRRYKIVKINHDKPSLAPQPGESLAPLRGNGHTRGVSRQISRLLSMTTQCALRALTRSGWAVQSRRRSGKSSPPGRGPGVSSLYQIFPRAYIELITNRL